MSFSCLKPFGVWGVTSLYMLKVHLYRWKFLEGHLIYLGTCLTDIRPIREG